MYIAFILNHLYSFIPSVGRPFSSFPNLNLLTV